MVSLYMIGGTMGIGKTAVCQQLKKLFPDSVFLDGDWCWDADPFYVTEETKEMVMDNICHILNNFLHCSAYQNVIFGWLLPGTSPYIGTENEISKEPELKVEVTCKVENLQRTMEAVKEVHPYEEPVINVIPLYQMGIGE